MKSAVLFVVGIVAVAIPIFSQAPAGGRPHFDVAKFDALVFLALKADNTGFVRRLSHIKQCLPVQNDHEMIAVRIGHL